MVLAFSLLIGVGKILSRGVIIFNRLQQVEGHLYYCIKVNKRKSDKSFYTK